jgi:hypothetical protein
MQTTGATKRVDRVGGGKVRGSLVIDYDDQYEFITTFN